VQCGKVPCHIYSRPNDAFIAALKTNPRILGIGEAHALRGTEGLDSSTKRFTRDFLPLLAGRATDLVVEVLLPNARCRTASAAAKQEQKSVTEKQAPADQNEFVALGNAAFALGIKAHALEPTCEDLARIAKGGPDAIAASLDAVTRLTTEKLRATFVQRGGLEGAGIIVAYGGAMHNDAIPGAGREPWAYGPAMRSLTAARYTELDLIVPEYIAPTPAWQSLSWYPDFDAKAHPTRTTLMSLRPDAFVLVFPTTQPNAAQPDPSATSY
jgi:hypothetical protein